MKKLIKLLILTVFSVCGIIWIIKTIKDKHE